MRRPVVGFYRENGKTKPITKPRSHQGRKIIQNPTRFKSIGPITAKANELRRKERVPSARAWKLLNKKLLRTQESIKIMMVNGSVVRKYFYYRFWHGAHCNFSPYIPPDEIWIERGLSRKDTEETILHELLEIKEMEPGKQYIPYEIAHRHAEKVGNTLAKLAKGKQLTDKNIPLLQEQALAKV